MTTKSQESRRAEALIYSELDRQFEDVRWRGWDVVLHPVYAGLEMDLLITSPQNAAFAVEVRWGQTGASVHLGTLAHLARLRDALQWPGRVDAFLLTNMSLRGKTEQAAREVGVRVVAEESSDPRILARRFLERLPQLHDPLAPA